MLLGGHHLSQMLTTPPLSPASLSSASLSPTLLKPVINLGEWCGKEESTLPGLVEEEMEAVRPEEVCAQEDLP